MADIDYVALAAQLRRPEGDFGRAVARNMNESNRALTAEACRLLDLDTATDLLELGMGNGGLVPSLLAQHPQLAYTGADYAPDMVEEATRINADAVTAGRARFVYGDAAALPFPDAAFDRILTVNTLYFWPDPAQVLAEFARILRPGGRLALAIRQDTCMEQMPFTLHAFTLYPRPALEALFAASPFATFTLHPFHEALRTSASGHTMPADSWVVVAHR